MDKLTLYHYYEAATGPFKNLSALSNEEAAEVMKKIKSDGKIFASRRPDDYLQVRRKLESKAREIFVNKGGKPRNPYPHYMTLGECEWIQEWYKDGKSISIPLSELDPSQVSFTYGDLFPTMRFVDGKPYRGQVYTVEEIAGIIDRYGLPQEWNKDGEHGPERYIEVQIWDDRALTQWMEEHQ